MSGAVLQGAFPGWPVLNSRLTAAVGSLTADELARSAGPDRWPLWAVVGHLACQRVFWLCDFAGEERTPESLFPRAIWECPGDEDLVNVLSALQLVEALEQSYAIVDRVVTTWTFESLDQEIDHSDWEPGWRHTRGFVIDRVHSHDVWHAAEANEILTAAGLPIMDPWA